MRTIKLINGDIALDKVGRVSWIEGDELLIQAINLRLNTLRESLFYDENYGHPVFQGKLSRETLENYIKESLLDDERISDLNIVYFKELDGIENRGNYEATMEIIKQDGQIIEMQYLV